MSGFEHTLAGLCDGISSIYATAASSYRVNGNINGHTALTVCAFCAPIRPMTAEHTPIRMRCSRLQKIFLRINRHSPDSDGFAARMVYRRQSSGRACWVRSGRCADYSLFACVAAGPPDRVTPPDASAARSGNDQFLRPRRRSTACTRGEP